MIRHAPDGYECPFCALASGARCKNLHSTADDVVYRDDLVMAFIASHWEPRNPGHVLVAPIRHFENLYELPDDVGARVFAVSRKIAIAVKNSYCCDGISTRQHNEPAGYQDVWHYHLHVFPRYAGDELYRGYGHGRLSAIEERRPFAVKLRVAIGKQEDSFATDGAPMDTD